MKNTTLALILLSIVCSCTPGNTHLPRAKAEEIKVGTSRFDKTFYEVYSKLTNELHSLMVVRDGKVIYEKYATGHSAEEHHVLWSATKTFTATAVGFAWQEGLLDIYDPILKYFNEDEIPSDHDPLLDKVTIRNLLTMSSGIADTDYNFEPDSLGLINPVLQCLSCGMRAEPGTQFVYNNNDTHLAGIIVSRVTGMKMRDYLDDRLLSKLGIRDYDWWEDPAGNNIGSYGLFMTTESIAKMALFMLQKGVWEGRRLLSEEWLDMAMSEQIFQGIADTSLTEERIAEMHKENDWTAGYGFQMWMCKDGRGCRLDGANGQFGIILPEKNTVVVMTSKCWETWVEMDSFWRNVYDAL